MPPILSSTVHTVVVVKSPPPKIRYMVGLFATIKVLKTVVIMVIMIFKTDSVSDRE